MSSIRSHFRHHAQQQQKSSEQALKSSSRIPTKATSEESNKKGKPAHHGTKLAKKSSRSLKATEPSSKSSTARTEPPMTGVEQPTAVTGKRISVPSGTTLSAPPAMRTPSLVSGSSVSTFDSPRSGLRRKPSGAIDRYAAQRRTDLPTGMYANEIDMRKRNPSYQEPFDDTVLGLSLPSTSTYSSASPYVTSSGDEHVTREFTPPALSIYAPSATPSTRFTDSPFSHAPTPSSASSYSSGMLATTSSVSQPTKVKSPPRSLTAQPSRSTSSDEVPRSGLLPVRESSTSSSNTTVRGESKHGQTRIARSVSGRVPSKVPETPASRNQKQPPLSAIRPSAQVPPELAHLNVDPDTSGTANQKSPPPARPSREGTLTISDMSNPYTVVQSDLPRLYTTYHKRTPSQDTPVSSGSPSLKSRFGFSRSSSRNESHRVDSAVSPPPAARSFNRGTTPDAPRREAAKLRRKDSPAVGVAPSPEKSSRFGLFSRKSKSEPPKILEKPKRQPSKGPAAGTGHEGYGRFGARGRSGSVASSSAMSSGVRSPSTNSSASSLPRPRTTRKPSNESKDGSDLDDFLRERLNPVILRGSGSAMSAVTSNSDLPNESIHAASSKASSLDSLPRPRLLPSAMSGSSIGSPVKRPSLTRRTTSDSSDDEYAARYPSIATRRSMTRMSSADSRSPVRMPPPINTTLPNQPVPVDSYDEEVSAWPQTDSTLPHADGRLLENEGQWLRSPASGSTIQSGRKWNFFQRATASPHAKGKERVTETRHVAEVPAHQSPYRGVAHYAMLGPVEPIALEEAERIALENETSADESMAGSRRGSRVVPYERRHVSLLPSPPSPGRRNERNVHAVSSPPRIKVQRQDSADTPEVLHARPATAHQAAKVVDVSPSMTKAPAFPLRVPVWTEARHLVSTPEPIQDAFDAPEHPGNSPRQPRLSPVGRIPRVVSRRDRDRKLPDTSFSRPFARTQPRPTVKPPGSVYSQIRDMASPIEGVAPQPISSTSTRSGTTSSGPQSGSYTDQPSYSTNRTSMEVHDQDEFLAFPGRKYSEQSYSSSSHGHPSWNSTIYNQQPQQEDVWNEYNDFLDEVMPFKAQLNKTQLKTPTTGSSLGAPFHHSSMLYDANQPQWPPYSTMGAPPTTKLPMPPSHNIAPTVLSVPQQISRFLQPSMSPLSPDTISGLIGGYGNRSTSTLFTQGRNSGPYQARTSTQQPNRTSYVGTRDSMASSRYSRGSAHSRSASLPEGNARNSQNSVISTGAAQLHDAQLSGIAEIPHDKKGVSTNMRLGALMTSKWLSFGRVLFSPAHNEMQFAQEPKVLVIDGLSSDWSFYVALSYPSAEVYNLTPSMPGSPSFSWPDDIEKPPPNHRQIPLGSIATPFPFPRGFFTAVVFRFPSATTEEAYTACIAECKRVLRPGGYLEVAVLDLDLMNMGSKARSAVRGLKTRMQQSDSAVCLRNLSDVLVSLIGRRGFDTVQRCIVGVPAAGRIPRSQDISSNSSGSSGKAVVWRREPRNTKSQEFSFADLLRDARTDQFGPGRNNDESITKMVAKVGRWWYSTCYEKALLPSDRSIWSDHTLLRECEKQGTSFRLLICHAQKPTQTRRRTVSV